MNMNDFRQFRTDNSSRGGLKQFFEDAIADVQQAEQAAWDALQSVPSYIETQAAAFAREELLPVLMEDALLHTDEHPYCTDATCPCHEDNEERKK